jgi:7-carboxy-7-deazaguanine synthase
MKDTSTKKFRYSEIFGNTFQGEGKYTGVPTVWFRSWGCNFNCSGFGQENLNDKSTWVLDYENVDVKKYTKLEELPVFKRGCDSSYSWSKKFESLSRRDTAEEIVNKIENFLRNEFNPKGTFFNSYSKQWTHMAFTGGEPMLAQTAIIEILNEFKKRNNLPKFITIETNGTQKIREQLGQKIKEFYEYDFSQINDQDNKNIKQEWFWSVSPKLYISGEEWNSAIRPEIVEEYYHHSKYGQLKYVVDNSERAWYEVEKATELYKKRGIDWEVWIMPVGSEKEDLQKIQAEIAEEAMKRGYNFSARLHCLVFNNVIGK